jgi:hypothetical protein
MPLLEDLYNKERAGLADLDPFVYNATSFAFNAGTAGLTAQSQIQVDADSDFVVRYINFAGWVAGADPLGGSSSAPAPFLIQIQDTGSGRNWSNNPVPVAAYCGGSIAVGGFLPAILPEPRMVVGSAIININLTIMNAALFPRLDISFVGEKVFYFKQTAKS